MRTAARCGLVAAASLLLGHAAAQAPQLPPIGTIDFFGLRTIDPGEARRLLPFDEGDTLPQSPPEAQSIAMAEALGVERVRFFFTCCDAAGALQLYVGVDETAGSAVEYYEPPTGDAVLPPEIVASFDEFLQLTMEAVLAGNAGEDRSQGHALAESSPPLRSVQERFVGYADRYRDVLADVLRESADARHRAMAAHVLGYVQDKAGVVDELTRAVLDPDEDVRNYATRSLAVIAEYASSRPELGIEIPAEPFVDLLDSGSWSDRNKGLALLSQLTAPRDAQLLARLRERSLPSLIEMCRWRHWGHAEPACLILQRVVGLPDDRDEASRERTIEQAEELTGA